MKTILIIKLSALGDMVQATPAFHLIKNKYPNDRLILLTTYVDFAQRLNIFDQIIFDPRKRGLSLIPFLWMLYKIKPDVTYDLQSVDRTRIYRSVLTGKIYHLDAWKALHSHDRLQNLFGSYPELDLTPYQEPIDIPKKPYALVIPGASLTHPEKRWAGFPLLCQKMIDQGLLPVIIGGKEEIFQEIPGVLNLCGKTSVFQVITLAYFAEFAVGNDTGPIFLASSGKCKTFAIHGPFNPPERGGHKGNLHQTLFSKNLTELSVDEVLNVLSI